MKVLIVEDDPTTARSVELVLASKGIICDTVSLGSEGAKIGKVHSYELVILDLMLPDVDGYEVLLRLRAANIKVPVMILSGIDAPEKKVRAFGLGADDYVTKPFNNGELLARVEAIVRRFKGYSESIIRINDLEINLDSNIVTVEGNHIDLTNKEYSILKILAMKKGQVLSKKDLLDELYSGIDEPDIKIIDVFVCKLRKKLVDASSNKKDLIETIWGIGYSLKGRNESAE